MPTQLLPVKIMKAFLQDTVKQMKKNEDEREKNIFLLCKADAKPVNIKVTLVAGHWTLYGSVMVRFENLPITYEGNNFEVDFSLMLLEPIEQYGYSTTADMVKLNGLTTQINDLPAFESWLKQQVSNDWNQ